MAKISANGCHEIARFEVRMVVTGRYQPPTTTWLLRSDGAVLRKLFSGEPWTVIARADRNRAKLDREGFRAYIEHEDYEVVS